MKSILPLLVPTTPPSTDRDDATETAAQTFGAMLAAMMAVKADKTGEAGRTGETGGTGGAGRTDQVDAAVPSVTTAAADANRRAAEPVTLAKAGASRRARHPGESRGEPPPLALAAAMTLMPPTVAKIVTGQDSKPADTDAGTTASQPHDGAAPPAAAPVTASMPVASAKLTVPMTPVIPAGVPAQRVEAGDAKITKQDGAQLDQKVVVEKLELAERSVTGKPLATATPPGADVRVDGPTGTPGSGSQQSPSASQHARVESAASTTHAPVLQHAGNSAKESATTPPTDSASHVSHPVPVAQTRGDAQTRSESGSMGHKDHQDKPTAAADPVTPAKAGASQRARHSRESGGEPPSIPTPAFGPQPPAPQAGAELSSRQARHPGENRGWAPSSRTADIMPDLTPATGADRVSLRLGDDGTRLQVTVRGDTVHARIVAPDAAMAQALTGDVQEMQRALGDKGFGDAKIVVNQNSVGSLDGSAARRFAPDNPSSGDTDRRNGQQADRSQDQQHRSAHQHRSRRERERRDG